MRYVCVPEPVTLQNPLTDESLPGEAVVTFARSGRMALFSLSLKGQTDAATLLDIRRKFDRAEVGRWIEFSDDEWKLLEPEFKRPNPQAFSPAWLFSSETHQRSILDAETKMPAALVAVANGSATAS